MTDYIPREALLEKAWDADTRTGYVQVVDVGDILAAPAADVAPVVRCEDCIRWDDDPDTYGTNYGPKGKCMKSFETMFADDFCSYGERREK